MTELENDRMNLKSIFLYIFLYLGLNAIGIYIATMNWWADGITLSYLKKESFSLVISAGICWIGILYLSILIIRILIVDIENPNFVGPIDLSLNEMYQKKIGIKNATKFKNALTLIAFPIMILTIFGFIKAMKSYESYQLNKYGIIEKVIVKEIRMDVKQNPYVHFDYGNGRLGMIYLMKRI